MNRTRIRHSDVEGLRVGRFASQVNTTCIVYRLGETVIDTGPPNQWRRVRRFLQEREVRQVLVTHHHEDHGGNLARAGSELGSPRLLSPRGGIEPLARGFPLKPYQRIIWGRPQRVEAEPVAGSVQVSDSIRLTPIAAPGHSEDMTCYLEPDRGWLFTGDLYIASRTRYLRQDEDLGQQIESLRRILNLEFETVFCSHRGAIEAGEEALAAKLDFLESLIERVSELRSEGRELKEITRTLAGREDLMSYLTGFHFSKRNLIRACWQLAERS